MNSPNILWICTDQQRFDTLGCYGNRFVHTPNVDRLAQTGVLFEHAYCQNPVCTPSRASFLTGRYPRTTRCRQNGQSIPEDEVLITKLLADAGYTCGLSGKLHLSACNPRACPTTERRIDDGYAEFHWSHHPAPDWPANDYVRWLREQGVEYGRSPLDGSKYVQVGMPAEHHQTTWCALKAVNFIEAGASLDRPWLFSYNCFDPHPPFDPPEEYLGRYVGMLDEIPLPNYVPGELGGKPPLQLQNHQSARGYPYPEMTEKDHRLVRAAYWAMVDVIDREVGRMLDALDRTGQRENTIVIFTSDHGEMLGDHGIYLKGPYLYEPAVHVPLVISWPGVIAGGRRSPALVELTDIAPTLLRAVGLERRPSMQGESLWPLLSGGTSADRHRDDVYCEFYNSHGGRRDRATDLTMVRTERHKLVAVHGQDVGELYDLEEDPHETHNRWADAECQTIKLEMLQRLCDRMAWTVDPLPVREAAW